MQTVLKYYLAHRFVLICKPISALCYSMLRHREIVHLKTCHNFDHFTKKEMQNTSRLNKMSWWKVKSYFSFFLAPFLTFTSGVGMAAISFYVVIVKTEQTIKGEATHAEKAAAPGRVHCRTPDILQKWKCRHSAGDFWWKRRGWKATCLSNKRFGWRLPQKSGFGMTS